MKVLYCKTFNREMINLKLYTQTSQWDVMFFDATKHSKALNLSTKNNLHLISFYRMIDVRPLANCTKFIPSAYTCLITGQNNKPCPLSQITRHCFSTMEDRLKGNRTLEYLFMYY